jgi:hypothetical protein
VQSHRAVLAATASAPDGTSLIVWLILILISVAVVTLGRMGVPPPRAAEAESDEYAGYDRAYGYDGGHGPDDAYGHQPPAGPYAPYGPAGGAPAGAVAGVPPRPRPPAGPVARGQASVPGMVDPRRTPPPAHGYVFLSYSGFDRPYVDQLARHLGSSGVAVWYDVKNAGEDRFDPMIADHIDSSRAVLVVMSPASRGSEPVEREINWAARGRKPIIPVLLADCPQHALLGSLHHEDVRGGRMPGPHLVQHLRHLVG